LSPPKAVSTASACFGRPFPSGPMQRLPLAHLEGLVEDLEKGNEGGLSIWRFIVRSDAGAAVVVEIRGSEIHGALREGDRVSVSDTGRSGDVLCPNSFRNDTLKLTVSALRPGHIRQLAGKFGITAVTAVISTLVSVGVTAAIAGSSASQAPPGEPSTPSVSVGGLLFLAMVLFVFLWVLWFAIWGRRWPGGLRLAGTLAIALAALVSIPVGLAVR
jgi:hypothetical protein